MLEAGDRQLLLEALRPPDGYRFDQGIGTTYSLDLLALMMAPLAFTMFDQGPREEGAAYDSLEVLESLRRYSDRLTLFCHAGRTSVPRAQYPVQAHIEDALALAHTADLPLPVVRRLVPGFCRSALEAAFIRVIRRRRLAAGTPHADVEEELTSLTKVTTLAAVVFFNDREKGGDVMARLNRFGPWAGDAFKLCKEGAHQEVNTDLMGLIRDTEKLTGRILELP